MFGAATVEIIAIVTGLAIMLEDPEPEVVVPVRAQSVGAHRSDRA